MRILAVSNTVFSMNDNMARTMSGFFRHWDPKNVAQLYFSDQVPGLPIASRYYRITDGEILKSAFTGKSGKPMNAVKTESSGSGYQSGQAAPVGIALRNARWKLGKWDTPELRSWIDGFNPEMILLGAEEYTFIYDIALEIARFRKVPLTVFCVDDIFAFNPNEGKAFGVSGHRKFLKKAVEKIDSANVVTCSCDQMTNEYKKIFHIPCFTLKSIASFPQPLQAEKKGDISYIGNLQDGRAQQLIKIGSVLKNMKNGPQCIKVYSEDPRPAAMTEENGIKFCSPISPEKAKTVMAESLAMVFTEASDPRSRQRLRYAVSPELADLLMSGTCLFAYGPAHIASMEYLRENQAAVCAEKEEELESRLSALISDTALRARTEENAVQLAGKNHSIQASIAVLGGIEESFKKRYQ